MAKKLVVNVDKLWHDTYLNGGDYAHKPSIRAFGEAFQETVHVLESGVELPIREYPVSKYHLSDLYGRFTGRRAEGLHWCKVYMGLFKDLYKSISTYGYDINKSTINVRQLDNDMVVVSDGHKRFSIIKYLDRQKKITVKIDDKTGTKRVRDRIISERLDKKIFSEAGKTILYQPIIGYEACNGPKRTKDYFNALETITGFCAPVQGKTFLDIGSCYGFFALS